MSEHRTHSDMVKDKAVSTLRQLAATAVENGELARLLGMAGQGWIEDELARWWRLIAKAVEGGHLVEKLTALEEEPPF